MDIHKLKLDAHQNINLQNFPASIDLGIESVKRKVNAVIYYASIIEDLYKFIEYCNSIKLPDDNRVILVFANGKNPGVTRNTIMAPFNAGKFPKYKLKAPMICSLSEELTACVFRRINDDEPIDDTDTFED